MYLYYLVFIEPSLCQVLCLAISAVILSCLGDGGCWCSWGDKALGERVRWADILKALRDRQDHLSYKSQGRLPGGGGIEPDPWECEGLPSVWVWKPRNHPQHRHRVNMVWRYRHELLTLELWYYHSPLQSNLRGRSTELVKAWWLESDRPVLESQPCLRAAWRWYSILVGTIATCFTKLAWRSVTAWCWLRCSLAQGLYAVYAVGPSDISTGQGGDWGSQQCCAFSVSESPLTPRCPPCMQTLGFTQGEWPSSDGAGLWGNGLRSEGVLGEAVWGRGFHSPLPMVWHTSFLTLTLLKIQPPFGVRRHLRSWPRSEVADCPCNLFPDAWLTMTSALSLSKELGCGGALCILKYGGVLSSTVLPSLVQYTSFPAFLHLGRGFT